MTLIDSLEYYYNRDDQVNLRTQGESEPVDDPFDIDEELDLEDDEENEEDKDE